MASEKTPLMSKNGTEPPSNIGGAAPTAYFLDGAHRRKPSSAGEESQSFHTETGEEVDTMPKGGVAAEFNPRPVSGRGSNNGVPYGSKGRKMKKPSVGGGWLDYVAADSWMPKSSTTTAAPSGPAGSDPAFDAGEIGTLIRPRKVPIKVEPKVYFSNERTFFSWLRVVVILAAGSITIVTYSKDEDLWSQLYGIILLPVSIAFIFYSLWQYLRRAKMIQNRQPGPYIDVVGPTTLTVILMATIIAQFCAHLHSLMYGN